MRILQVNLNHCKAAQDLLQQTIREERVDVVIISEPYIVLEQQSWQSDTSGKAAIWACGKLPFQETMNEQAEGFVRVKINGVYLYSCYMPPSLPQEEYEAMLDHLVNDARDRRPLAVAGDFNAWALEWGSTRTDRRGQALLEALAPLNLVLLNDGVSPTFVKGEATSIIDLSFVSDGLAKLDTNWRVTDICTQSDHRAITWNVPHGRSYSRHVACRPKATGWCADAFDEPLFREALSHESLRSDSAERAVEEVMERVRKACDVAMPRRKNGTFNAPVYWWNASIADLRQRTIRARRLAQRARGKAEHPVLEGKYREARAKLTHAIKRSKKQAWLELVNQVEQDPWGKPYRVVMSRLKGNNRQQPSCPEQLKEIVATLFPRRERLNDEPMEEGSENVPSVTEVELFRACNRMGNKKSPGLDGIPNVALKAAVRTNPRMFQEAYTMCLKEGTFPKRWKWQKLVLLPKENKPPDDPSSYRPLCMLDTAGKILESIIHGRLEVLVERCMSDRQYGFRKGRSTQDAINRVIDRVRIAIAGKRWKGGAKKYCLAVALDIKNAFNSARWDKICAAMDQMGIPKYLKNMVRSYFKDRRLLYETNSGQQVYQITGGVPQGSVLGPILWNIMYDDLLKLELPIGAELIAFADDALLIVVGKHLEEIQRIAEQSCDRIQEWMSSAGLTLAAQKTEAVLFSSRKKAETVNFAVGSHMITSQPYVKYLGVVLDARLNFSHHVEHVAKKAAKVATTLSWLMPNTGGPREGKRKLLISVVSSVQSYAIETWGKILKVEHHRRKLAAVQRLCALRATCAFRTVSEDAACVIASLLPLHILAEERRYLYEQRSSALPSRNQEREEARLASILKWQAEWDASTKGRWTYRLIARLDSWVNRNHGETNYYLTQLLSGHGCFREYLHRFGHEESPECPGECKVAENAEHAFFQCPRFESERARLEGVLGGSVTVDNLVDLMLESESNWDAVSNFATVILKKLRVEERARREREQRSHTQRAE